jgi:DNA-binding LytR/AlgR family response regulator
LNIAICDPDPLFCTSVLQLLRAYCEEKTISASFFCCHSGEALLKATASPRLVLMEYHLGDMTGAEAANALRRRQASPCEVIFLTSDPSHALEGFFIQASDYLLKPLAYSQLEKALDRCMARFWDCTQYIEITCNRVNVKLPVLSIRYAEVQKNLTIIHTKDHIYQAYLALDDLTALLPAEAFLRCHRSYLVHLLYVDRVERNNFVLQDGAQIPIRMREKVAMHQTYQDYLFRQEQKNIWRSKAPPGVPAK